MTEHDTFNILQRLPFNELINVIGSSCICRFSISFRANTNSYWADVYHTGVLDINILHYQIVENFEKLSIIGWTAEEFIEELEKKYGN